MQGGAVTIAYRFGSAFLGLRIAKLANYGTPEGRAATTTALVDRTSTATGVAREVPPGSTSDRIVRRNPRPAPGNHHEASSVGIQHQDPETAVLSVFAPHTGRRVDDEIALLERAPHGPPPKAGRAREGRVARLEASPRTWFRPNWGSWPLLLILAIQAALSLRLVWSNTAFSDEALYMWAGHLEWEHWLHGVPISAAGLPTHLSGAPVVYPPLGALADSIGGLAAARLLSLAFMLATTTFLHGTARRLFGDRAAAYSAALFVGAGPTQFLGAFATYDALALFLLALATWIGVCAAGHEHRGLIAAATLAGGAMALADAAKYAATLFDPVVIGVIFLAARRAQGIRRAWSATAALICVWAVAVAAGLWFGGHPYWTGITTTTLTRAAGATPAPGVLFVSGKWIGAIAFLAVCGAVALLWSPTWPDRLMGSFLAGAVFLAPAEQARIHTLTSLFKHVGYGAWFASIVGGYALTALSAAVPPVKAGAARRVAAIALALAAIPGIAYAAAHFAVWPNTTTYVAQLQPWLDSAQGQVLVDNASIPEYYLRLYSGFDKITNSSYFAYTDPASGRRITQPGAAYADAIRHRFFAVISLTYGNEPAVYAPGIVADIRKYGGYRLISSIPYETPTDRGHFLTWVRDGSVQ